MSPPEESPRLPGRGGEPVFDEAWQAQAFALAIELSRRGYFTWPEWTDALARELKTAAKPEGADIGSNYYTHWLAALERLVLAKSLTDAAALAARKDAWLEAYRNTPHGKPIALSSSH